jgi:hypothetical protein
LLVVVPRHPQRFGEVHALAQGLGWKVARRSEFAGAAPDVEALDADVLIGDSMGEMFAWYAFADLAIIGGSFAPLGGQNLIEACAVGRPVIVGPHMFNFEEISRDAIAAGAAVRAADMTQAVKQSLDLLADEPRRHAKSQAAKSFAARPSGCWTRSRASSSNCLDCWAPTMSVEQGISRGLGEALTRARQARPYRVAASAATSIAFTEPISASPSEPLVVLSRRLFNKVS